MRRSHSPLSLLVSQRDHRIDARRPVRRDVTGGEGYPAKANAATARARGSRGFIQKSMLAIRLATLIVMGRPTAIPDAVSMKVS